MKFMRLAFLRPGDIDQAIAEILENSTELRKDNPKLEIFGSYFQDYWMKLEMLSTWNISNLHNDQVRINNEFEGCHSGIARTLMYRSRTSSLFHFMHSIGKEDRKLETEIIQLQSGNHVSRRSNVTIQVENQVDLMRELYNNGSISAMNYLTNLVNIL
jgi:hypothetical protein